MSPSRETQLDALAAALARDSRIHAWQARRVVTSGLQTYLVRTQLESERRIRDESHGVAVFVRNGDKVGRATFTIDSGEVGALGARIDQAVYMAGLGGDAPWELPGASEMPSVESFDPELAGDRVRETSRRMAESWRDAAEGLAGARPSSLELFCGTEEIDLVNSAGLSVRSRATRVSLLSIVLAEDGGRAAERQSWEERRRAADLDPAAIVRLAGEEARDMTRAMAPPSGQYPVVIDAAEIPALLSPIRINASAESLYRKSSRFEIGKPLPTEGEGGEPITVASNAIAPFGLESYSFDQEGVPGRRVEIVNDGVFRRPWATKQFADYENTEATGAFANWEVPAGKTPLAELCAAEGRVLYVRSFSWLNPDPGRGNFGSEVRVGYLYENGAPTPVKGGAVSGSVYRALGSARFASERVLTGDYIGAAAIRCEGLTITGT